MRTQAWRDGGGSPPCGPADPLPGSLAGPPLADPPPAGPPLAGPPLAGPPPAEPLATWADLRGLVLRQAPALSAPRAGAGGLCRVCLGPARRGHARCGTCDLHVQCAGGMLADVVIPVAFAVKGGLHARRLWQYKSARAGLAARADAVASLRALLLVFLRDHGPCLWRAAGIAGPTHLAVVPSARGRPGTHPLGELVSGYVTVPWARLAARPGREQVRDLDPERFSARPAPGARVVLLDDTWATGCSAQSAAIALRLAGAAVVVTVALGRHAGLTHAAALGPAAMPFRPGRCPVHVPAVPRRQRDDPRA